jgi:hypothetical protein
MQSHNATVSFAKVEFLFYSAKQYVTFLSEKIKE